MVKRIGRRFVSLLLTFVTILTMLPAMTLPALAAVKGNLNLADRSIGLSYDGNADDAWSVNGTSIIGAATSTGGTCEDTSYNSTLTITNKKSTTATLSFDYSIEQNSGKIQVDGAEVSSSASFTKELAANETVKVYIQSGSTSAATKITLANVVLVSDVNATATFVPAENGSYSVDGRTITETYENTQSAMKSYEVVANPNDGYQFLGWYDVTNGRYINADAEASLSFDSDRTITARFASETAALFETGGWLFDDLDEAGIYAQATSQDKITLASDGKITGNYTIPSGVTLLIPFDDERTLYADKPESMKEYVTPNVFRKLTMAPRSSITVKGAISVGGKHCHTMGSLGPSGRYGQIDMAAGSSIMLNSGAKLYAWGYITGDGQITANSGATVYEYFQVRDWRGGTATSDLLGNKQKVFPFSQYYVQNIEAALTIQAGATERAYISISASAFGASTVQPVEIDFIGNTNSLFRLGNEASLTKKYDPKTDRTTYTTIGTASLDSLALDIPGYKMNSKDYVLPVNSNMTLNILSGRVAVNSDAALLPGAQITIARGAELIVSDNTSLYVYAKDQWKGPYVYGSKESGFVPIPYSPTKTGTRTLTDAKINVNGTLTAVGSVYTTDSGADICSSKGGGRFVQQNAPGQEKTTHQVKKQASLKPPATTKYDDIPITPAKLKNNDNSYIETKDAVANDTFTYCKCTDCSNGTWVKNLKVAEFNATQYGTLKEAANAAKGAPYVRLLHSTTEDITATNDLYLDLNGRTVTGDISVTGDYKLYGMDSSTGKGYVTAPSGKIVGTVTGCAPTYQTPGDTNDCYVAIQGKEADKETANLSFHRFNISVTGYRFELATGDTPQCALFFIGKFQGDAEAKAHLSKLGFTLKGEDDRPLGTDSSPIPANLEEIPDMPDDGKESTSEVVRTKDGAFLFEAYLMRSFDKGNHNGYTEKIKAIAQATFKNNDGTQDSEPKLWSFEDAWKNPGDLTSKQQEILDNFLQKLGITKQAE